MSIVGHYIKERTRGAQFIIISLRNDMFELADRLVGVYKTHNATKSIAIDPGDYAAAAAPPAGVGGEAGGVGDEGRAAPAPAPHPLALAAT